MTKEAGMPVSDPRTQLLERDSTGLVLVDLQAKLMPAMFDPAATLRNANILLRLAETLKLPVILTAQYVKGLGPVVPEVTASAPGITPIEKDSFGCFGEPGFLDQLKARAPQARTLVVAGVETHICVMQTVLGALAAGYLVHVASDAVCSRTRENWRVGLERMERAGAVISSTEMVVYELLGRSGTAEFKAMLPVLK
jgi:nicotinamidase-related amidase